VRIKESYEEVLEKFKLGRYLFTILTLQTRFYSNTDIGNWKFNSETMTIEHDLYIDSTDFVKI
jgi:hypothetical protein